MKYSDFKAIFCKLELNRPNAKFWFLKKNRKKTFNTRTRRLGCLSCIFQKVKSKRYFLPPFQEFALSQGSHAQALNSSSPWSSPRLDSANRKFQLCTHPSSSVLNSFQIPKSFFVTSIQSSSITSILAGLASVCKRFQFISNYLRLLCLDTGCLWLKFFVFTWRSRSRAIWIIWIALIFKRVIRYLSFLSYLRCSQALLINHPEID